MWPKFREETKCTKSGIKGYQLAWWLNTSGYNEGKFCYTDVMDENGVNLKDKLDILHEKYKNIRKFDKEYVVEMVDAIEEYCKKYNEWPKQRDKIRKI